MPEQSVGSTGTRGEMTCPPEHTSADDRACRYGGAYYHSIIRALWMWQLRAWDERRTSAPGGQG